MIFSEKISVEDKQALRRLFLGVIAVAVITFFLTNLAEVYLAICRIVSNDACEFQQHRYTPTWELIARGLLLSMIGITAYGTFIILRRSINRSEATLKFDEPVPGKKTQKAKTKQTPSPVKRLQSPSDTRTPEETEQFPMPAQPSTIHGAPTKQSSGANVEVVPVKAKQVPTLRKKTTDSSR